MEIQEWSEDHAALQRALIRATQAMADRVVPRSRTIVLHQDDRPGRNDTVTWGETLLLGAIIAPTEYDNLCKVRGAVRGDRSKKRVGRPKRGTKFPVAEIKRLAASGMSQAAIARQYGCSGACISRIVRGLLT